MKRVPKKNLGFEIYKMKGSCLVHEFENYCFSFLGVAISIHFLLIYVAI